MTGCPDYSQYSLAQLRDAARTVDGHADPAHFELLLHWIREREKQAEATGNWFTHMLWGLALGRIVFTLYAGFIILVTDTAAEAQVAVQWQLGGLVIPIGFGVYGFRRAARKAHRLAQEPIPRGPAVGRLGGAGVSGFVSAGVDGDGGEQQVTTTLAKDFAGVPQLP